MVKDLKYSVSNAIPPESMATHRRQMLRQLINSSFLMSLPFNQDSKAAWKSVDAKPPKTLPTYNSAIELL